MTDIFKQCLNDIVQARAAIRRAEIDHPAKEDKPLTDLLSRMVVDVKSSVVDTCAKVAEIHRIKRAENDFHHGYNTAVAEIAAAIRKLSP